MIGYLSLMLSVANFIFLLWVIYLVAETKSEVRHSFSEIKREIYMLRIDISDDNLVDDHLIRMRELSGLDEVRND